MSLFEWLWERNRKKRTGRLETAGNGNLPGLSNGRIVFNFVLTLVVLALPFLAFEQSPLDVPRQYVLVLLLESVYITAGYYIRPKPDSSNYGWMGGLMDNPFRISDDINRALLFFQILLYPGRILGNFIAQFMDLLINSRSN